MKPCLIPSLSMHQIRRYFRPSRAMYEPLSSWYEMQKSVDRQGTTGLVGDNQN